MEFGAKALRANQRGINQVLHPRLVEVDDPLIHEIGEVQHAGRDGAAAGQRSAKHGAGQRHPPTRGQRKIAFQVERPEFRRCDVQREHGLRQTIEAHVTGDFRMAPLAHRSDRVDTDRVTTQRQVAVDVGVADVQRGNGRSSIVDIFFI